MDPKKHPLTTVAELITKIRPAQKGMWCLFVQYHTLDICLCQLVPKDSAIIARINSDDINNGLHSNMWNHIEAKIRIFIKQGVLEWQHQKP